ncbi:hypothetical protein ACLBW0_14445 [Enterobacteriaceae bacterium C34A]
MNGFKRKIMLRCMCPVLAMLLVSATVPAIAATREEMIRLDKSSPPGTVIVCRQDFPQLDANHPAMTVMMKGVVVDRVDDATTFDVETTFSRPPENKPDTILHFRQISRLQVEGQEVHNLPNTLRVTLPSGTQAAEAALAARIRRDQPEVSIDLYSQIEFTNFPSYLIRRSGIPTMYCHLTGMTNNPTEKS